MTVGDIVFGWVLPLLGLAFFVAGAWANASILLRKAPAGEGAEQDRRPSPIPFAPGLIGAIALWNGPYDWMRSVAWVPLVLDTGCLVYLVLLGAALWAARRAPQDQGGASVAGVAGVATAAAQKEADARSQAEAHYQAFAGCLLGTAIGDALGLASEGLSPQRQARMFPRTGRYHLLPFGRGMCSDDTEHTVLVAQSLIQTAALARDGSEPIGFRADLAWRLRWWLLGLPAGIGMATLKGILKLWLFVPARWQGAFSAGNGPAMRSALIGVFWANEPAAMRQHVEASTQLTHSDPKAAQAALAVAIAAGMAAGMAAQQPGAVDPAMYASRLRDAVGSDGAELCALVDQVAASVRSGQSTQDFAIALGLPRGVTGYSFHSVPVALHAWLAHPGDYSGAVLAAIRCGGDTDTVAAITGAIAGAGCGRQGLPPQWLSHLVEWPRSVAWMDGLARQLAETRVDFGTSVVPTVSLPALILRNILFLGVVLAHGLRRLLPPY